MARVFGTHRYLWLFSLTCLGCAPAPVPLAPTADPVVTVAKPIHQSVQLYDEYTGRIEAIQRVELKARVSGYLVKVEFEDGQEVKSGQKLFEIDPREYEAALAKSEADVQRLEAELKLASTESARYEELRKRQAASQFELDKAIATEKSYAAQIDAAKATVARNQLDVEFSTITSPIDGRIGEPLVKVGNLVASGTGASLLSTIVSVDPMYVYFDVDERSFLRYRSRGQELSEDEKRLQSLKEAKLPFYFALADETDFKHEGLLDFADVELKPGTGTMRVRGVAPNKDRKLISGLFTRVRVAPNEAEQRVMVVDRAIATDQSLRYVLVVNKDNIVERRDIVPGRVSDGLRIIDSGLKPDEWVIVNGLQRVQPGMKVDPQQEKMPVPPPTASEVPSDTPPAGPTPVEESKSSPASQSEAAVKE